MADGESATNASPSSSAVSQSTHSDSDSESVASEHEYSSSHASSSDLRPPPRKKGKSTAGTGKFKSSWRLPPHITASSKGSNCKVCASNFCISHGGLNDIKRHVGGPIHKRKLAEMDRNARIESFVLDRTHTKKVISAELMMAQSFQQEMPVL